jgi:hypothetical protein
MNFRPTWSRTPDHGFRSATRCSYQAPWGSIEPLLFYRFSCVQTVADYHRRVFDQSLGEGTRGRAFGYATQLFEPEDVVAAADRADREIPG